MGPGTNRAVEQTQPAASSNVIAFNTAAFTDALGDHYGMFTSWSRTFETAGMDKVLDAFDAASPDLKEFTSALRADPEMKTAMHKVLVNEGGDALYGLRDLMTGEGAISPQELQKMLQDPMTRGPILQMMDKVAGNEFDMDYAKRFIHAGMEFKADPNNPEKRQAVMDVAAEAKIDLAAGVKTQAADSFITFARDLLHGGSVESSLDRLTSSLGQLGLDENALQSIRDLLGPIAGVMQYMLEPYAKFAQKWGPEIMDSGRNIADDVKNIQNGFQNIRFDTPATGNEPSYKVGENNRITGAQNAAADGSVPDQASETHQEYTQNRTMGFGLGAGPH